MMNQKIIEENQKNDDEKKQRLAERKRAGRYRGSAGGEDEAVEAQIAKDLADERPLKELLPYEKVYGQTTEYFSTLDPNVIEDALIAHLR